MSIAPADPTHQKVSTWNGKDLKGTWHVTIKIDGVRALWDAAQGVWLSRAGTVLNNVPVPLISAKYPFWYPGNNCELYLGSLKDTNRAWRTKHLKPDTPRITHEHLYSLNPIDKRLDLGLVENPTAAWLRSKLATVNAQGFEGLVLRQGETWLKVKPSDTYDVRVLSVHEGNGKFAGTLGYFTTHMGKVGSFSITDAERMILWNQRHRLVGATIEVECMQLTPDGKFRHARFIRERFDKVADK
jgi:ATP-dependent DNA ligase